MRVHGTVHLFYGGFEMPPHDELSDQLGGVGSYDVGPEDLGVLGAAYDLYKALRVAPGQRATVGHPGKLSDVDPETLLLGLLLRESDRRDLGTAIRAVRDVLVVHRAMGLASDGLDTDHPFVHGLVGQQLFAGAVADGVDALEVGAAALVGQHEPALHGDALLGVPQPVGGGAATDGDQEQLGLDDRGGALGVLDGDRLGELEPVLTGIPNGFIHDGGQLVFGPDGYLYVSTGEAGDPPRAADPDDLGGKVLRITPDGDPAPGNPDPDSPVWTLGHRNIQGLAFVGDWVGRQSQSLLDQLASAPAAEPANPVIIG